MPPKTFGNRIQFALKLLAISGLVLTFSFAAGRVSARQEQPPDQPGQVNATLAPPDEQTPQGQAPSSPEMPPASPSQAAPPQSLTLPAGTVIQMRVNEWLSSDRNLPGDAFSAVLAQPIVVNGWVVARRGQAETGQVSMAQKAGHGNGGASQLGVQLSELTLVDGQQLPVQTELVQSSAGSSNGRNAAIVGTTTGVGAAIGAAAGGGSGAAAGAIVGGAAGIIGAFSTRGRPTVIPPESLISFRLRAPLTISTDKSPVAFQPVTQDDYNSRAPYGSRQQFAPVAGPGYPPPASYYGYPYAYAYPYPYGYYSPFVFGLGFYGGYGPRFGGWRGGWR